MRFFNKKKETLLQRHALQFLNVSQFLGVVNDNVFKFLIVFLFIDLKGAAASNEILFWVGVVYVIPFLLFSPAAGVLADRFSKQRMIIALKFSEVVIMALGIVAFAFKSDWASYTLLFFLSLQSALFGPPKYSIIPELVSSPEKIPKANGLITSCTYLGIIVGTFLASFLTQVTNRNFPLTACFCTLIAIGGIVSALFIPYTEPKRSKRKINPLFLNEIYRNLKYAKTIPYLFVAILGSASFLFVGAYFQLNVIPFAIQSLGLSDIGGGYLFLLTAVGIAFGAFLAGHLSKKRIELGLACISGMIFSAMIFLISIFSHSFPFVLIALFTLGLFGGLYIVPFDAYVQTYSPDKKRGQIVAASNFLSFCGVLVAPMLLYLFGSILHLSAARGFTLASIIIFLMVLTITSRFSGHFFNYICRLFHKVRAVTPSSRKKSPFALVFKQREKAPLFLLSASDPHLHFYILREKKHWWDFLLQMLSSVDYLYVENKNTRAFHSFKKTLETKTPCFLLKDKAAETLIHEMQEIHSFDLKVLNIHQKNFKQKETVIEFISCQN